MAAKYFAPCPIARYFPPSSEPAKSPVRQFREGIIRNESPQDAAKSVQHYLRFQRGTGMCDSIKEMRELLAKHSQYRTKTLSIKNAKARRVDYLSWAEPGFEAIWQWWPYHLRALIANNIFPSLIGAAVASPSIDLAFYEGASRELLKEINLAELYGCQFPLMQRMLVHWEKELTPILDKLEQLTHCILLEIGPAE